MSWEKIIMFDAITIICLTIGLTFFIGGVTGLLRFPDVYTRLHALTKADNIGLGFIVLGVLFQCENVAVILKLGFIWGLVAFSSATICFLIANAARKMDIHPWRSS